MVPRTRVVSVSWGIYAGVFVVVVAGSTVQSSVGMGHGLIAAPLLRLLHPELLPGPIVMAGLFVSIGLAARNSRRADLVEVAPALVGRLVGIGVAIGLLATLSERGLTIVIGSIVLTIVALRLYGFEVARSTRSLAVAGVASGVGGAIAALGGAPMGLLYEQDTSAREFRGPMGAFMTVGSTITIVSLVVFGELDGDAALLGLSLLPPVMVGWVLARWVTPFVDRGFLRPAVFVLSASAAIVLIVGALL